jgi:plastocyanin
LYLVPVKPGTYRIYCNEFMHDTMGMHGTVTIQ